MKSDRKRKKGSKGEKSTKKSKHHEDGLGGVNKVVFGGHSTNLHDRHIKQLESLLALMPVERYLLKATDDSSEVLERTNCLSRVYLQWNKNDDRYFLWVRTSSEKIPYKFEFDGGFTSFANLEVNNPLLVFSESFDDNDHWKKLKQLLQELFVHLDEQSTASKHDYVFAFTRTGLMFHFRIFKVLSVLASDMDSMKLQEVSPAFVLEPVAIHEESAGSMGVSRNHIKSNFFDDERLIVKKNDLSLVSRVVFYDKSCPATIPHVMQIPQLHVVMLPASDKKFPCFEFNTSCKEFFDRYHAFRETHVPGTGADPKPLTKPVGKQKKKKTSDPPDPTQVPTAYDPTPMANTAVEYKHITGSMKVFCRSLIRYFGDLFKEDACLDNFTEDNIFLGGGRLIIVGVEVLQFTKERAEENCATICDIINGRMPAVMPPDVHAALNLLTTENAVDNYELILNNVAWMEALERNHMVGDLYEDFTEFLRADDQVRMTQKLVGVKQSEAKFKNNWLIYACQAYSLPPHATESEEGMLNYLKRKASELQLKPDDPKLDVLKPENSHLELVLYTGRRYFGSIRHLYTHLSDTARKWKKMNGMTQEEKDLVISSEFAATLSSIQEHTPAAFSGTGYPERASYARFKRYFKNNEFYSSDEKEQVVA